MEGKPSHQPLDRSSVVSPYAAHSFQTVTDVCVTIQKKLQPSSLTMGEFLHELRSSYELDDICLHPTIA